MANSAIIETRRSQMAALLAQRDFMLVIELCRSLNISESTARRDLDVLQQQGLATRTFGGAISVVSKGSEQHVAMAAEKRAIAGAAAGLFRQGQTILMWGGTTCYCVAEKLRGKRLSVVTNSVDIASLLTSELATEVTMIGGYVYPRIAVTIGELAAAQLAGVHASALVMGCSGINPEGVFNTNQILVDVQEKMMQAADTIMVVADHSKFGLPGLAKLAELHELDIIVTDSGLGAEARRWLDSLAAKVIIAE